jgi:hypothetical protein
VSSLVNKFDDNLVIHTTFDVNLICDGDRSLRPPEPSLSGGGGVADDIGETTLGAALPRGYRRRGRPP